MRIAILVLLVLTVTDILSGLVFAKSTAAQVKIIGPKHGPPRRAIVILPGFVMAGSIVGEAFAPYVRPDDALITVDYAKRGVDPQAIYRQIRASLDSLEPEQVFVYGASMGGLIAVDVAERYRRDGEPFGELTLVLDSAPTGERDLKRPRWLLAFSCVYRGGVLSTVVWAAGTMLTAHPPAERGANEHLIKRARRSGAWVGTPAATSQACFMRRSPLPNRTPLAAVASSVTFLQARDPQNDPIVRIPQAEAQWRAAFPDLRVVTMADREGRWHLPLVERPRETVEALLAAH